MKNLKEQNDGTRRIIQERPRHCRWVELTLSKPHRVCKLRQIQKLSVSTKCVTSEARGDRSKNRPWLWCPESRRRRIEPGFIGSPAVRNTARSWNSWKKSKNKKQDDSRDINWHKQDRLQVVPRQWETYETILVKSRTRLPSILML